ncbi:MAG: ABC transporter substrate-binding protein [Thermodesulfobacteriota bacterium]
MLLAGVLLALAGPANAGSACTDQAGRRVEVPDDPQRVVCLAPSLTETVFALEQGQRVVGVSQFSDYPARAADLPSVGSYVRPDLERILARKPDLCLAVKDGNPKQVVQRLEQFGIPVYAFAPYSLGQVLDMVQRLGRLLDCPKRAQELHGTLTQSIMQAQTRAAVADDRPRVLYLAGLAPFVGVGGDTYLHELITAAGGINVTASFAGYPRLGQEDILRFAPDVVLVPDMGGRKRALEAKAQLQKWPNLPAVAQNRIYTLDADTFNRPGPRLARALDVLSALLYPIEEPFQLERYVLRSFPELTQSP